MTAAPGLSILYFSTALSALSSILNLLHAHEQSVIRIPDEIDGLRRETVSVLGNNDLDLVSNGRGGRGLIVAVRVVFFSFL